MSPRTKTNDNKTVILFPRGALDDSTKALLSENGYLGIEADDPKAVVTVLPIAGLVAYASADDIVNALIDTVAGSDQRAAHFGNILLRAIKANRGKS